jgi:drug/metabolite transporter (DMT)-like permease
MLLMLASAFCFAAMALAAKLATRTLPAGEVTLVRFAIMLLPIALVPDWRRQALRFERVDLLLYRGLFGGLAVLLYFFAIAHVPVGIATLLNYSSPVFSVLFAALFLGERADPRLLAPFVAALAGVFLVSTGRTALAGGLTLGRWELAGLASAVLSGAAVAAIRAARRSESSWAIYGSFSVFGLVVAAPFGVAGFRPPGAREWALLAAVGGFSIAAQLLMTYAYRWVTNLQAGVLAQLTVVLSLAAGALWLGERLSARALLGCVLTLAGVVGVVWLQSTPRAVE